MSRDVELRIEALVIDGVTETDAPFVGDALARELVRLLESPGAGPILTAGREIDRLDAGALQARPLTPAAFGAGIAHAVYRGLDF